MDASSEIGTKPRAVRIVIAGPANVGVSSDTAAASASNDHDTAPADTPFQTSPVATTWRAMRRISLYEPSDVRITVGSSWNGTRNPPAASVRDMARSTA